MILSLRQAPSAICAAILFAAAPAGASAQAPAAVPAEITSFDEVTSRLDRGGSLYLYLSTAQWLDGLSKTVAGYRDLALSQAKSPEEAKTVGQYFDLGVDFIRKSGIEQISGLGMSSLAIEPGTYRNTVFFHHYRGKENGFLGSVYGVSPHPLGTLDLLPANSAFAFFSDLDFPLLVGTIRSELEASGIPDIKKTIDASLSQFAQVVGLPLDSVLQSLGQSSGIVLTLDPAKQIEINLGGQPQMIPNPRLALLIEVKDDRLFKRVDQVIGGFPGIVKVDEPALRMRTMAFPATPKITVRSTVAQTDKYLIISSDDSLVRDILAAQTSGHGFKSTPTFTKMSAGLPAEGNGFSLVTQTFVDAWKNVRAQMVKAQSKGSPSEDALMQKIMDAQGVYTVYGVSSHVENGWLTLSKGGQSGTQMLAPLLILPAVAIGAAIPAFTKIFSHPSADNTSRSLEQARKIAAADHNGAVVAAVINRRDN